MFRTKQQKETHCTACPIAELADIIGDSCTILLVRDLLQGPKRFKDIETSLSGISSRTLTNKLKALEAHGIIERKAFKEKPPRVEYTLTEKGRGLEQVTAAMKQYAEKFL